MYKLLFIPFTLMVSLLTLSCKTQSLENMKTTEKNALLCDPDSGACEMPLHEGAIDSLIDQSLSSEKVKLIYFTDPICSSCWGIEPQLRKLKLSYGDQLDIEYRMGGLLPDWSYNSGGISKPSDVAHHWDEVSVYYDMPIDGDLWLEDPLHSSYPPSIAFKAAEIQDKKKAQLYMRTIREMVFLHKINIAKEENLVEAAKQVGLNTEQFKSDLHNAAKEAFKQDLALARTYGVRGFPSIYLIDATGNKNLIYGTQAFEKYESLLEEKFPALHIHAYQKDWENLFNTFESLTAREYAELSDQDRKRAEEELITLTKQGKLVEHRTKNGSIWRKNN